MASVSRLVLIDAQALTATANSEPRSLEAYQSNFIGYIIASSVHASTTVAAKIQHSADKTNWLDLDSFTNIVGASGFEAIQITDSILPNVRAVVTLSGATQQATVTLALYYDKVK